MILETIAAGVGYLLGKNYWKRPQEERSVANALTGAYHDMEDGCRWIADKTASMISSGKDGKSDGSQGS